MQKPSHGPDRITTLAPKSRILFSNCPKLFTGLTKQQFLSLGWTTTSAQPLHQGSSDP